MTKRMLIDASHNEETRVVVLDGNRLEEFDLEAANRLPLKGNIYLAKVVRVEPSLQAAFVEYGGNRHGFLAFSEIHPDYYQIPVADRQRLLEMQAADARDDEDEDEDDVGADYAARQQISVPDEPGEAATAEPDFATASIESAADTSAEPVLPAGLPGDEVTSETAAEALPAEAVAAEAATAEPAADTTPLPESAAEAQPLHLAAEQAVAEAVPANGHDTIEASQDEILAEPAAAEAEDGGDDHDEHEEEEAPPPETIGGEGPEESDGEGRSERRIPPRFLRHYKIQEVIRRRQIMLVQVVKEERGSKGAALTTYISMAGRFSVLMPNSPRGGGVSRKITSGTDRKRLREVIDELHLPQGMSIIVRTAGAQRPKPEIRRDCEYLLRLWDNIRERTMQSAAPALIYEEADLIKRSIRDTFSRDVEEIHVDGELAYKDAREFMRMLMPQHVRKIQLYRDPAMPLFARHQVEAQLDAMHSPTVQLKSGGYLVINQTEALVAIDVNSGRSTRERHIEDTALRTNLEAADEIGRQLRLRDLAGLIVVDFIDMESNRNDAMVERRMKEALRHDRARIQLGRISHFGLLEMSRQRLRPSLAETTFVTCPHCQGRGQVRSIENSALHVLRAIEEEGGKRRAAEILVHVHSSVALYLLNRKREKLAHIEARFGMAVLFEPDDTLLAPALRIDRVRAADPNRPVEERHALRMDYAPEVEAEDDMPELEAEDEPEEVEAAPARANGRASAAAPPEGAEAAAAAEAEAEGRRRKRRRRRRGGKREDGSPLNGAAEGEGEGEHDAEGESESEAEEAEAAAEPHDPLEAELIAAAEAAEAAPAEADGEGRDSRGRRRRGRRGGRGRREDGAPGTEGTTAEEEAPEAEADHAQAAAPAPAPRQPRPAPQPRYQGPTPADPFAGQVDDIFAAMEAAERAAEEAATRPYRQVPQPVVEAAPEPVAEVAPTPKPIAEAAPPVEAAPAPVVPVPAVPVPVAAAPEPVAEVVAAPEPAPVAAPEPVPEPAPAPEPVAVAPAPVAEPVQGTVIQPKLLEELPPDAPKKRGWWKR